MGPLCFTLFWDCFEAEVNRQLERVQDWQEGGEKERVSQAMTHLPQAKATRSQAPTAIAAVVGGQGTVS